MCIWNALLACTGICIRFPIESYFPVKYVHFRVVDNFGFTDFCGASSLSVSSSSLCNCLSCLPWDSANSEL